MPTASRPRERYRRPEGDDRPLPGKLREALIHRFQWESLFSIENAQAAVSRGDQTYVAGCTFRSLSCVAQVPFDLNRRYLIKRALSKWRRASR
jgi:hypothetical protein